MNKPRRRIYGGTSTSFTVGGEVEELLLLPYLPVLRIRIWDPVPFCLTPGSRDPHPDPYQNRISITAKTFLPSAVGITDTLLLTVGCVPYTSFFTVCIVPVSSFVLCPVQGISSVRPYT
jgi:hypothetical protein